MSSALTDPGKLTLERLLRLHTLTRDLAALCQKHLRAHLDTMAPLFRPRRFLGDHIEGTGREPIVGAERAWTELLDLYRKVALKPFDLRPELPNPLPSVQTQLALHDWEYHHGVQTERGWQTLLVTSPLTWVLTYASPYSLGMLRQQVAEGHQQREPESVRAFVLRACLMYSLFQKYPGMTELMAALRYRVEVRMARELGDLPLVTVSAPFQTIRPADDLIAKAAGFAGGGTFSEVVDVSTVRNLSDPLREEALKLLAKHGEEG